MLETNNIKTPNTSEFITRLLLKLLAMTAPEGNNNHILGESNMTTAKFQKLKLKEAFVSNAQRWSQ